MGVGSASGSPTGSGVGLRRRGRRRAPRSGSTGARTGASGSTGSGPRPARRGRPAGSDGTAAPNSTAETRARPGVRTWSAAASPSRLTRPEVTPLRTCSFQVVPGAALMTCSPESVATVAVGAPRTITRVTSSLRTDEGEARQRGETAREQGVEQGVGRGAGVGQLPERGHAGPLGSGQHHGDVVADHGVPVCPSRSVALRSLSSPKLGFETLQLTLRVIAGVVHQSHHIHDDRRRVVPAAGRDGGAHEPVGRVARVGRRSRGCPRSPCPRSSR